MRRAIALGVGLAAATLAGTTHAETTSEQLEKRIAELEQTVRLLSRKLEVADEVYTADKAKAATSGRVKAGLDGFSLVSPDSQSEIKLRATTQFDGRFFVSDEKDVDTWLFRRVRPTLEGKLGSVAFKIMPEFADDDADLMDGYADWNFDPHFSLRAGQFKPATTLERLQSASALVFNERAFPTELAPNRDRGLMLYSNWLDRRLGLELGLTNGTADGRTATNSDVDGEPEVNGRVFFEAVPGIGFGVAGTWGEKVASNDVRAASSSNANAFLPRYRSPAQNTIFQYKTGVLADGDHTRIIPQAYAYVGPVGVMAEYVTSEQDLSFGALSDELTNTAAQLTGVWAITGEDESYKGIKPINDWGALELALRWSRLEVDDNAFDASPALSFADPATSVSEADQWSIGLNWSITQNLKAFTSYSQTEFDGGAASGEDRDDEKLIFTRIQLNY